MITEELLHEVADDLTQVDPQELTEVALFAKNAEFKESPENPERLYMHEPTLIFGVLLGIAVSRKHEVQKYYDEVGYEPDK